MTNLDETELARLEELACAAGDADYSAHDDADDSTKYAAAACNAVPALIAEIRRRREALSKEHRAWQCAEGRGDGLEMENAVLREKVEEWEWLFEVIEYDVYEDNPLSSRWGHDMSDKERETYVNARISYAHIEDAAREAVHADRE